MAGVRVESRIPQFRMSTKQAADLMLAKMRNDAFILSKAKVPVKEGDLSASGKQERKAPLHHRVSYGETLSDPYAPYQERGSRRDGSHKVRNYTTAGTGKDFLKNAANNVISKSTQYAKQAFARVK